ncbi:type VI secretion system baseplate subunit TssK [Neisseria sp. Ec49-e6-T10]|uniref:type VI secretion system baseplate subunit TssK n=1 Tax=Neisseria sp. Ec49-e6-T10 TaxID=3140744 RepID=UPI003EBFCFF5
MALNSKVVWSEGTFLCPQHFQQFERYIDGLVSQGLQAQEGFYWGFSDLALNEADLLSSKIRISKAEGVFPDGTMFFLDDKSIHSVACTIPKLTKNSLVVLALPLHTSFQNQVLFSEQTESSQDTFRYQSYENELYDVTNVSSGTRPVLLSDIRPVLMLEQDLTEAYTALPVAYIHECKADGQIILNNAYIPPTLNCQKQINLKSYIDEIKGLLEQRAFALASHLSNPNYGGIAEVRDFLMLETINRYTAYMLHQSEGARQTHPEGLFVNLSKLCADLATYMPDKRPINLPVYQHNDLEKCYRELIEYLRRNLSLIIEQQAIRLPLELRDEATRVTQTPAAELLEKASFIIAVRADIPSEALRQRVPTIIKISTVEKIRELVAYHLPGVQVHPLSVAPRELPYHSGYSYFELDKQSELWQLFDVSSGMAIHLAGDFPNLDVEFWAIKS